MAALGAVSYTHLTMSEIIDALAAYDISAERKSLYNDIENLRVYGLDVIGTQAVSYTHLDVYKRQLPAYGMFHSIQILFL